MKLLLSLLLFAYTQICIAQNTNHSTNKYSIAYPETWRLDTSLLKTGFVIYTPLEDKTDSFADNLFLMIQDLHEHKMDIDEYKEITDKQFESFGEKVTVRESKIVTKNGIKQFQTSYAMNMNGRDLEFNAVCFIKNEKAYLLTFTAEQRKYALYKELAQKALDSFTLK